MRISDWSSDVCSSDLLLHFQRDRGVLHLQRVVHLRHALARELDVDDGADDLDDLALVAHSVSLRLLNSLPIRTGRSEERRVGKECVSTCRSRWSPYH